MTIDWPKIILWSAGGGVGALAAFIAISGLQPGPRSLAQQAADPQSPPSHLEPGGFSGIQREEPPLPQERPAPSGGAATPEAGTLSSEVAKQDAFEAMMQSRAAITQVPTPNIDAQSEDNPQSAIMSATDYANQLGTRIEAYRQARSSLRSQLSPAERARLHALESATPTPEESE